MGVCVMSTGHDDARVNRGRLRGCVVRTELADLGADLADLRVKCSELASQLDAMRAERTDLCVKRSELANQLDAIEDSTSWRVTAPLRHIRRFISRFSAR
jgi:hypothetical protein